MSTWTILSSYISEPGGNICMNALSGLKTASEVVQCDLSWWYENRCCWLDGAHLAGGEETSRQEHWPKCEIFLLEYLVFLIWIELNCNASLIDFKHKVSCLLFGSMLKSQKPKHGKEYLSVWVTGLLSESKIQLTIWLFILALMNRREASLLNSMRGSHAYQSEWRIGAATQWWRRRVLGAVIYANAAGGSCS